MPSAPRLLPRQWLNRGRTETVEVNEGSTPTSSPTGTESWTDAGFIVGRRRRRRRPLRRGPADASAPGRRRHQRPAVRTLVDAHPSVVSRLRRLLLPGHWSSAASAAATRCWPAGRRANLGILNRASSRVASPAPPVPPVAPRGSRCRPVKLATMYEYVSMPGASTRNDSIVHIPERSVLFTQASCCSQRAPDLL